MNDLATIISRLKAPKDLYNTFGKYKYRSCESILEEVKPILKELGCTLNLSDEVVNIGNANYLKATATLITSDNMQFQAQGWAREDTDKKGMDAPQMTGTASSYARKYALNGLFCIDDTKDADTDEYRRETASKSQTTTQSQSSAEKPKNKLTLDQVKGREAEFVGWLWSCYQLNNKMNAKDKIAEVYDCDFATTQYLCQKFEEYCKNH